MGVMSENKEIESLASSNLNETAFDHEESINNNVEVEVEDTESETVHLKSFRPVLYNFKIHDYEKFKPLLDQPKYAQNSQIKYPDFATLLDHTLGVIWLIYEDKKNIKHLEIHHIEWALKFLEGMKTPLHPLSPDIEMVIEHLKKILEIVCCRTDDALKFEQNSIYSRETIAMDDFDRSKLRMLYGEEMHCDEYFIPISLRNMMGDVNKVRDAYYWDKTEEIDVPLPCGTEDPADVTHIQLETCSNLDETTSKAIDRLKELEDQSLQKVFDEMENYIKTKDLLTELGNNSEDVHDQSMHEVLNECYGKMKDMKLS